MKVYLIDDFIEDFMNLFNLGQGYLTYIVALGLLVAGIYHQDWHLVSEGLALAGVRRAIANSK